jgi:hypothetical protein
MDFVETHLLIAGAFRSPTRGVSSSASSSKWTDAIFAIKPNNANINDGDPSYLERVFGEQNAKIVTAYVPLFTTPRLTNWQQKRDSC